MKVTGHLLHAVVDGAAGTDAVTAPSRRDDALRLQRRHHKKFWCTTEAGGCGGRLELAAGPVVRPYFRHVRGQRGCALAADAQRASRAYEHIYIQHALRCWLTEQGLEATIEHDFGANGRADLHVVVQDVSHSIEVQLSPISDESRRARDQRYRRQVEHVTWLYGPAAVSAAGYELLEADHALLVRRDELIRIGTLHRGGEGWDDLDQCLLTREQFWTPHLDAAAAAHQQWQQAEAERLAAEREERRLAVERERAEAEARAAAERRRREAAEERRRWVAEQPPRAPRPRPTPTPLSAPAPVRLDSAAWRAGKRHTAAWSGMFPEQHDWISEQDWRWLNQLPVHLHAPAQMLAYIVGNLYLASTTDLLQLDDVGEEDHALLLDVLVAAELIDIEERPTGLRRWRRR